jgi:hypothetical protein
MKKADRIISLVLIAFAVLILWMSASFPPAPVKGTPGPAYVPRLLAAILILCSLVLFAGTYGRKKDREVAFEPHSGLRLFLITLLAVLVPAGLAYLGFLITCFGSTLIFLLILRVRYSSSILISTVVTAGIYLSFHHGLQVQFPMGFF